METLKNRTARSMVLLLAVFVLACEGPDTQEAQRIQGRALGTTYSLIAFTEATGLEARLDSVIEAVNSSMSTYIPGSLISRFNAGERVQPDAMFLEVLDISREVHRKSGGAFDPTVGVLVNAWGFGPGEARTPDSSQVDSLMRYVGLDKMGLDPEGYLTRSEPGIQLDFNAIAKGYALDRVGRVLDELGCRNYMFELGGEVVVRGKNLEKDKAWTIGIEDPLESELGARVTRRLVRLEEGAMASSGNYRKFRFDSITGQKYVHTIDPKTGYTRNSNILASSVLAPDCARADAYATALMAMELQAGIDMLENLADVDGYIIYVDGDNVLSEYYTGGFRERFYSPGVSAP